MHEANEIPSCASYVIYEAGVLSGAVKHADVYSIFATAIIIPQDLPEGPLQVENLSTPNVLNTGNVKTQFLEVIVL